MSVNVVNLPLQQGGGGAAAGIVVVLIALFALVVTVVTLAGMWKTFEKAGKPGWAAIIPIYNLYVMLEIGDNEWWWLLIAVFVPVVNIYAYYKIHAGVAKAFGQGVGFALGLWLLNFVFFPLLGFGDYRYQGTTV